MYIFSSMVQYGLCIQLTCSKSCPSKLIEAFGLLLSSFFFCFIFFFARFIFRHFVLILQSLFDMSICWIGYYPLSCRCLLGNESEKYVIENVYDFDLAIIAITIEHEESKQQRAPTAKEKWASNFRYFCGKYCSFLPMCLFCHFSLIFCAFLFFDIFFAHSYFESFPCIALDPISDWRFVFILHPLAQCSNLFFYFIEIEIYFLLYLCSVW